MTGAANSASRFYCWELLCVHPAVSAELTGRYHKSILPSATPASWDPGSQRSLYLWVPGSPVLHHLYATVETSMTESMAYWRPMWQREKHIRRSQELLFSSGRTEAFQKVSLAPSFSWEPYGCEKLIIPGSSSSLSKRIKQIPFTFNYFIMSAVWKTVLSKIQHIMKPQLCLLWFKLDAML